MAKKPITNGRTVPPPADANGQGAAPVFNEQRMAAVVNALATRRLQELTNILDSRRDIDTECGYPKAPTAEQYRTLYDREGVAERVVGLFPSETWSMDPLVIEDETARVTAFEQAVLDLDDEHLLFHYLHRVDELSGVGHYGILLLGLDDGGELSDPVPNLNEKGEIVPGRQHNLIYMRALDESLVQISQYETDKANPRFGMPVTYSVTFNDPNNVESGAGAGAVPDRTTQDVHWSRVIHVADNRKSSEVFGVPRMRPVYNRLYDLRKLAGGSAEMFWKGAFPGLAFETNSSLQTGDVEIDVTSLQAEVEAYSNGLQRYLTGSGGKWASLSPQVSDPSKHVETQLRLIAVTLGVPFRIFLGSEQAQLASSQDVRSWNKRIARRQERYVTPLIIRPTIDRLMALGVLPEVDEYGVEWPDLNAPTDLDKAEVATKRTEALAKYVAGGVDTLIPPREYLTHVMGMDQDEVDAILKAALAHIAGANPDADPGEIVVGRNPTPEALEPGEDGEDDQNTGDDQNPPPQAGDDK